MAHEELCCQSGSPQRVRRAVSALDCRIASVICRAASDRPGRWPRRAPSPGSTASANRPARAYAWASSVSASRESGDNRAAASYLFDPFGRFSRPRTSALPKLMRIPSLPGCSRIASRKCCGRPRPNSRVDASASARLACASASSGSSASAFLYSAMACRTVARLLKGHGEVVVRARTVGRQGDGPPVLGDGFVRLAGFHQGQPQVRVRLDQSRRVSRAASRKCGSASAALFWPRKQDAQRVCGVGVDPDAGEQPPSVPRWPPAVPRRPGRPGPA